MNIGIFGGTFDPPHLSHAMACLFALETTGVERILVIPCYRHPLGKEAADYSRRVAMCRLAMAILGDRVEVSELESQREGPSYTVDTLRILKKSRPDDDLFLLAGSDILEEKRKWKDFNEITRLARLLIIPRPGSDDPGAPPNDGAPFTLPDISSTQIRRSLKEGRDVSSLVSREVLAYIQKHGIYGVK